MFNVFTGREAMSKFGKKEAKAYRKQAMKMQKDIFVSRSRKVVIENLTKMLMEGLTCNKNGSVMLIVRIEEYDLEGFDERLEIMRR